MRLFLIYILLVVCKGKMCKTCVIISCNKQPSFGFPGGEPQWCSPHKEKGAINLRDLLCEVPECTTRPSFAQPGESKKRCFNHKLEGDIDVVHKSCENLGCTMRPRFAPPGESSKRCSSHKLDGDINVADKACEHPGCTTFPSFAPPGESSKRCSSHKLDGDVNVVEKTCEVPGCEKQPSFAPRGETKKRCAAHIIDGDVNVCISRCSTETCLVYDNIYDRGVATYVNPKTGSKDMCYTCHRKEYPGMHKRVTVSKEHFILAEIQRQIPELEPHFLVWDCKLPSQNCSMDKPDMVWKIKDTLIHVEVDENGEGHEDNTERIIAIHAASNLPNHKLTRFNPDKSTNGSPSCFEETQLRNGDRAYKRNLPEWRRRIPVLVKHIRDDYDNAMENVNVTTKKRKLFFYD